MIATFLSLLFLVFPASLSQTTLPAVYIDCGANYPSTFNGIEWLADTDYISSGTSKNISQPITNPILATARTFPLQNNVYKKFCYEIPVDRTKRYLVRTTYYYAGVNGNTNPPIFLQIVDGSLWSIVNTTDDYANGDVSYYEGVFLPTGKNLSVCVAANENTDSDPFISALEVVVLWDQLYNATDFKSFALSLTQRSSFGYNGPVIGYPDDQFNRYWAPFGDSSMFASPTQNLSISGIWNYPPAKVFQTRLEKTSAEPLSLIWPSQDITYSENGYYVALYFADDGATVSSRTFDVDINGVSYYNDLSVSRVGVSVFSKKWPLLGTTNITLTPKPGSGVGPMINAGEVFHVINAGRKTLARDIIAMISLRESFENSPADWHGDPCLPERFTWTGVTCSYGNRIRIVTLNLTSMGLLGSISSNIAQMTALNTILLGNNSLIGTIPDLSSLKGLEILHLDNNQLGGQIPSSLGDAQNLRELYLQNNNLTGQIPSTLLGKPGLNLRYSPGNPFLTSGPS